MKYSALITGELYTTPGNAKTVEDKRKFRFLCAIHPITLTTKTQPTNFHAAEIIFVKRDCTRFPKI
jgi:hypothetical protein